METEISSSTLKRSEPEGKGTKKEDGGDKRKSRLFKKTRSRVERVKLHYSRGSGAQKTAAASSEEEEENAQEFSSKVQLQI